MLWWANCILRKPCDVIRLLWSASVTWFTVMGQQSLLFCWLPWWYVTRSCSTTEPAGWFMTPGYYSSRWSAVSSADLTVAILPKPWAYWPAALCHYWKVWGLRQRFWWINTCRSHCSKSLREWEKALSSGSHWSRLNFSLPWCFTHVFA